MTGFHKANSGPAPSRFPTDVTDDEVINSAQTPTSRASRVGLEIMPKQISRRILDGH
jgi:hypothetical protein